jgi:hypothetical protein
MYLEQPHGNLVLAKEPPAAPPAPLSPPNPAASAASSTSSAAAPGDKLTAALRELVGTYERDGRTIEVAASGDKATLTIPGQRPYTLVEKSRDAFALAELPPDFEVTIQRDAGNKIAGLILKQPGVEAAFARLQPFVAPLTADELIARMIEAAGGEANLRKHTSRVATITLDWEHQGIIGEGTITSQAPNREATRLTLKALGKNVGEIREFFDGTTGSDWASFTGSPTAKPKSADERNRAAVSADFYDPLNAKALFSTIAIKRTVRVGDEEAYVVVMTPRNGAPPVTVYVGTNTFRVLKRETIGDGGQVVTEAFSDFRTDDGVVLPFTVTVSTPALGDSVMRVRELRWNVPLTVADFRDPALPGAQKHRAVPAGKKPARPATPATSRAVR